MQNFEVIPKQKMSYASKWAAWAVEHVWAIFYVIYNATINYVISTVFDSVRLMTQILFTQIPFRLQKGNKGNIQVELL